ncbi:MAG: hypothetical protein AUI50_07445 [Crenarchaeota archaeon 13_1_40CM_2_52_14]|nr:MAG: hypothetical protein AUI97_04925 [Crenarchaeota archaeon 13_1_40CM_3_52_17]OLD34203.1 MAG: hypothetical protein AUI50_07445 [Crenarchaeota archaeon 13_1_40CM_2_52_14]OLE69078.1 MAG: hypothetical protein AUF78_13010 [archaeon 13_1_20CM_2_51_12]
MCTGIVENTRVSGCGKGPHGWFILDHAIVAYDHPDHAQAERAVMIDLVNEAAGFESRIAVELTPQSARDLVRAILASLSRGEGDGTRARNQDVQ